MGPEAAARLLPLIAAESDKTSVSERQRDTERQRVAMKCNPHARSYGRAGGRAGVPRVRQGYGGGFGKNHTARSNQQAVQY
jgi:hypothetical protein